jgi:GNAT superfamily N-acetyltransferase
MKVRRAVPGDEEIVKELRIQALTDSPDDFDSTLERERARPESEWRRRLVEAATFLLEGPDGPKGIVAGVRHEEDPNAAFLVSMWVHADCRGTGGADSLIGSVLAWASDEGMTDVWLHVDERNGRARRCYERNGFRATGEVMIRDRDGLPEVEMRREVVRC